MPLSTGWATEKLAACAPGFGYVAERTVSTGRSSTDRLLGLQGSRPVRNRLGDGRDRAISGFVGYTRAPENT